MPANTFNKDLLLNKLKEFPDVQVENIPLKLNRESLIEFICKCKSKAIKPFRNIIERRGFVCRKCGEHIRQTTKKNTNMERYGKEHPSQRESVKEKVKQTLLKNYGVDNPSKSEEIRKKKEQTSFIHYGVTQPLASKIVQQQSRDSCMKKFGVLYPTQDEGVREKFRNTLMEKYNVENPSHYAEFIAKKETSLYSFKDYKMPSGDIRRIQGYENLALNILCKKYNEEDIVTDRKKIPNISYYINNKMKYHYPDIFIKSINKIIEVKSTWTYNSDIEGVVSKQESAILQGYLYEVWIFDNKGNLQIQV